MTTKRIGKWVIVLFLLAALPGMTAVMAQGQEPAKPAPAVTEPGESAAPVAYNKTESEPNNTCATADRMAIGDVIRGTAGVTNDVDYFVIESPRYFLADVDARNLPGGSAIDSYLCTDDLDGNVRCNDDSDGLDSMTFLTYGLGSGGDVCISVKDLGNRGGSSYKYQLVLSAPMLLSAHAANLGTGTVAGIPFRSEDILAWSRLNTGEEKWVMFFDGSDVGITKNVWNVATGFDYMETSNSILLGLAANQTVPGLSPTVTPYDVIRFSGQYGPNTSGSFSWAWRGSQRLLTTTGEKIDGIGSWDMYFLPNDVYTEGFGISTVGKAVVSNGLVLQDEDVGILERWYDLQWTGWSRMLDGSAFPGLGAEDVFALSPGPESYLWHLVILGAGNVAGHPVNQKDVFEVCPDDDCITFWQGMWHGPDHGWNYNIDAVEYAGDW